MIHALINRTTQAVTHHASLDAAKNKATCFRMQHPEWANWRIVAGSPENPHIYIGELNDKVRGRASYVGGRILWRKVHQVAEKPVSY